MFVFSFNKLYDINVVFLDDNKSNFQMKAKTLACELFDCACQTMGVDEKDYFGLQYRDKTGNIAWLDGEKSLRRQLRHLKEINLLFRVKFYIEDPSALNNEHTRYLFALQIAIDLKEGVISGSDTDIAVMISYILQADLGDYTLTTARNIDFEGTIPVCNQEIEEQSIEFYKLCKGMLKAEADQKLLDRARRLDSYGKKFVSCEGGRLLLCTTHLGVSIYEGRALQMIYYWPVIYSVVFKGRRLVVVHILDNGDQVEYLFDDCGQCRAYWKIVWENFSFYKDILPQKNKRVGRSGLFKRGSRFRYSGRTLSTMLRCGNIESCASHNFERSHSIRVSVREPIVPQPDKGLIDIDQECLQNTEWSLPLITEDLTTCSQKYDESCVIKLEENVEGGVSDDYVPQREVPQSADTLESVNETNVSENKLVPIEPSFDIGSTVILSSSTIQIPQDETPVVVNRGSMCSIRKLLRTTNHISPIYEIVFELYLSEYVYLTELNVIDSDLREGVKSILSDSLLHELTGLFTPLVHQHQLLCSLLSENLGHSNAEQLSNCASAFFSTIFQSLNLYSDYLCGIRGVVDIFMDTLSTCNTFAQECVKLGEESYIPLVRIFLRPAQQLYYYQIIIKEMSRTCMGDDALFQSFSGRLGQLLEKYQSRLKDTVEFLCLRECQAYVDCPDDFIGRRIVRMGVLSVDSVIQLAILFDTLLIFFQPSEGSFVAKSRIPIFSPTLLSSWDGRLFVLIHEGKEIFCETSSEEDKKEWVDDIDTLISSQNPPKVQNGTTSYQFVDPHVFSIDILQNCWKYRICSLSLPTIFSVFKTTFSEFVFRRSKLSKQKFFVILNNSCLYFFTDYFTKNLAIPHCRQKLCILSSSTTPSVDESTETGDKYQFKVKFKSMSTLLFSESKYLQNRWVTSVQSASI